MNVAVAMAATAMVMVMTKVTFGKVWKQFSVDLANEKVMMAAGAKRLKAKWDSEAERKLTDIWADILEESLHTLKCWRYCFSSQSE